MSISRPVFVRIIATLVMALIGCDGARPLVPQAETATGTWQLVTEAAGVSERWTIVVVNNVVVGQGIWSGGALCPGSSQISGAARGDSLLLDVSYYIDCSGKRTSFRTTPPDHIYAVLNSPTDLTGTRWIVFPGDAVAQPVHFLKIDP